MYESGLDIKNKQNYMINGPAYFHCTNDIIVLLASRPSQENQAGRVLV